VRHWLTASPARQLAALQQAWRDDPTWNDLRRVPALICDREMPWRNDPLATRPALALAYHVPARNTPEQLHALLERWAAEHLG